MNVKIKQNDITDCGAACLASISAHYKLGIPIARIRQYASTDKDGTNVKGLLQAAEKLGFVAKGVKGDIKALSCIPLPAIAHVVIKKEDFELHHYVVILKCKKNVVHIMDPAYGTVEKKNIEEFGKQWSGVLVLLEPVSTFQPTNDKMSLWERIRDIVLPHRWVLFQAVIGAVVYTVLGLSTSIYIEKITDYVLVGGNTKLLNLLSVIMIIILIFRVLLGVYQNIMVVKTGQLMDAKLILGYYKHLMRLPQQFFDTMRIGEITSRMGDAVKIRSFINEVGINLVVNVFIIIFSFSLMFTYYWKLALLVLAIIPFYAIIYVIADKWNKKIERKVMEDAADLESQMVESLNAVNTIKQFGIEDFANQKTENKFVRMLYSVYNSSMNGLFSSTSTGVVTSIFTIVLMWVGCYFVLDGEITPGELMSFFALIGYFTSPVSSLISFNKTLRSALIAADRLFEIMDLEREETYEKMELTREMVDDICISNLSFAYGTRSQVFEDFSLQLKAGEMSAIVGASGCGKTTIVSLLQNLYSVQSGKISIGNHDLKYISNASLRALVATVPQQVSLFSGTVVQNIALGEYEPDMQRIIQLVTDLGLQNFIERLPEGYQSVVGENGALLSGGEKQRLAIARALYRNPEILILDEATSSLDSISENYVKSAINTFREQGKTVIVIAHRLSTIRNADEIFVLEEGKLVENGEFKTLLQNKSKFYEMWRTQSITDV